MVERGESGGVRKRVVDLSVRDPGGGQVWARASQNRINHLPAEKGIRLDLEVKNTSSGELSKRSQKGKFGVSFFVLNTAEIRWRWA